MSRFVAFLRGVSPMNLKMAELSRCLEYAGYSGVRTVLSSGNVAFNTLKATEAEIASQVEIAMQKYLGRSFPVTVRSSDHLRKLVARDPYHGHNLPPEAKRVVTFLHSKHKGTLTLPIEQDGACILVARGADVFSYYTPNPKGPVFMKLIERTFGTEQTTRTWKTIEKCSVA